MWCIAPKHNAAFVCQMETVLETYKRAYDPLNPVVCMDETTKQCTQEVRASIKAKPGTVERYDGEHIRNGVGHLILFYSPLDKLDFIFTPKHGSWLNMAECEFSVLARQCLDRRIPDTETLAKEIKAWQLARNKNTEPADWRFNNEDARIKLKHLYPKISD